MNTAVSLLIAMVLAAHSGLCAAGSGDPGPTKKTTFL